MEKQNVLEFKKKSDELINKGYSIVKIRGRHLIYRTLMKSNIFFFAIILSIIFTYGCKNVNKDFSQAYIDSDTIQMLSLLKDGADINLRNNNLETPLHLECKKCIQLEKMYFELKKSQIMLPEDDLSADIKEVDRKWNECVNMIAFLLNNKADLDMKNTNGKSPFNLVEESESKFCLGLLSSYKLNKMLDKNKIENK